MVVAPGSASAANGVWNVNASGNWSTPGNWTPSAVPGGAGSIVGFTFNISLADKAVTIDTTSRTVGILNIGDPGVTYKKYTLAASGGASLILDNSGASAQINKMAATGGVTDEIATPVLLNSGLIISNNAPAGLLISGGVTANSAGSKSISNRGPGASTVEMRGVIGDGAGQIAVAQISATSALTLSGANTYSGGTTVSYGTLTGKADSAFGFGDLTVASGARLILTNGVSNDYIDDMSGLILGGTATLNLNFTGAADTIGGLSLDGGTSWLTNGTYNAAELGARGTGVYTGLGSLTVIPEPASALLVGCGAALIGLYRRCYSRD